MADADIGLTYTPEGTVRREWESVEANAVRIDEADAARLVEALTVDHAGSFNLFYVVRKHYWTAAGAEFEQVADLLEPAYKRLRTINDQLAVRIVELGGLPGSTPPTVQKHATVHLEAENVYDMRASLEGDLEGYATLAASMRDHVDLAADLGDQATVERLRNHLQILELDAHAVDQLLQADTLVTREAQR